MTDTSQTGAIIVTGAGQGIGRAFAEHLAANGDAVVIAEVVPDRAETVAQSLRKAGHDATALPTDVTDVQAVDQLFEMAAEQYGRVAGLVNNAGIFDGLEMKGADDIDEKRWSSVMHVNVWGTFVCSRAAHRAMKGTGGSIVNISSAAAFLGPVGLPDYVASKGAVMALTRALAREYGASRVRVNAVAPGGTWTEASEHLFGVDAATGYDPELIRASMIQQQFIKRQQYPGDVVGIVKFLLSDAASMISGQTIVVDGGFVLH